MSELNESANHLAKSSGKKHERKCQQNLQIFSRVLISPDKDFILLLACFGLIFTRSLTLLSLRFFSRYIPFFPRSQGSLIIFTFQMKVYQS